MGLFKDFKEDFSQAVNELVPGGDDALDTSADGLVVDTLGEEVDVASELSKLDGLLEQVDEAEQEQRIVAQIEEPVMTSTPVGVPVVENKTAPVETKKENRRMDTPMNETVNNVNAAATPVANDEVSIITASTTLTGDIASAGSFDIQGTINGNVACNGKLTVTGTINGNSQSSEFFADVAKIEGEVVSTGTVKVGTGSVIIGNITAASAVIAGAVKGDIDVQGPVVVDTSAVIMGNIKSRSVQINNGAVIEGFCSQCYADIDVQGLFESK